MNGASAEAQAYAVQTKGATGSAQAFTAEQQQVQAVLKATAGVSKAASIAAKAFSTALNMIVFAAIAKGIQMIVSAVDDWIHRVEKANEAMSEAHAAYESTKVELENVNSELVEQRKKLDELSAKEKLTYAEKDELENLKEITEELRIQEDIKKRELAHEQKESADKAVDAYNTQSVSSSPNDINACQDAFNKLTAAYIKGFGVLSEVTEAKKAGTIAMLKQMGISNAAAIVEQALIENEKMLAAQKYATAQGCDDLRNATYDEINALIAEGKTTEEVLKYLAKLALEKWELNEKKLDTKADCDNLLNLAVQAGVRAGIHGYGKTVQQQQDRC